MANTKIGGQDAPPKEQKVVKELMTKAEKAEAERVAKLRAEAEAVVAKAAGKPVFYKISEPLVQAVLDYLADSIPTKKTVREINEIAYALQHSEKVK